MSTDGNAARCVLRAGPPSRVFGRRTHDLRILRIVRTRPSLIAAIAVSVVLVCVGFWMVIAGWPEQTPTQEALLDLGQLPMAGAVLVGIVEMTWARRLWLRSRKVFVGIFAPAAVAILLGAVFVAVAYGTGLPYSGTGQLLIWIGIGLAFIYLAVDSLRREVGDPRTLLFEEVDDSETGDDHLADWGDEEYEPEGMYDSDDSASPPPDEAGRTAVDDDRTL
jgi:hypothetical protein